MKYNVFKKLILQMKIEILCTGDEILSGKTVNTNYSYMARRLTEHGFNTCWGTVVGDDRVSLVNAMRDAAKRADAVIVNGGLGPTIDDLSQQVAAEAAGVALALYQPWLERIQAWYESRGRKMPDSNKKQAMLPVESEFIDNPIGTACGFALDIDKTRFFFTPGVPKELHRMLDEQIIPRLQAMRGEEIFTRVKRFHTFGMGESRADILLEGIEGIAKNGAVKLGFQSHYPQLETKLTLHGKSEKALDEIIHPVESAVRERLGNVILSEDDETIENGIMDALGKISGSISILESYTAGNITSRLLSEKVLSEKDNNTVKRGLVSMDISILEAFAGLPESNSKSASQALADSLARSRNGDADTTHRLVVLVNPHSRQVGNDTASDVFISISDGKSVVSRTAALPGSPEWVKLGAAELALDCLRRFLYGLPVHERIDFEL